MKQDGGRGIPESERICQICNKAVETEWHFICECEGFDTEREQFYREIGFINVDCINDHFVLICKYYQKNCLNLYLLFITRKVFCLENNALQT